MFCRWFCGDDVFIGEVAYVGRSSMEIAIDMIGVDTNQLLLNGPLYAFPPLLSSTLDVASYRPY